MIGWKDILTQVKADVSIKTLKRWTRKHGLPVSYVGRTPVADPHRIEAWKRDVLDPLDVDREVAIIVAQGRVE